MLAGDLPENDVIPGVPTELKAFFEDDEEGSCILEDQKVEEVMHELLKEINGDGNDGKSIGTLGASPSFNMSGESCGPAFSGSGSTLMAGIEMAGSGTSCNLLESAGVVGPTVEMFSGIEMGNKNNGPWLKDGKSMEEGGKMEGWDEEEWLTRVLCCAPQVLEDYGM